MDKKQTMLIADDVALNRALLEAMFQNDYQIVQAENGSQALKIMEEQRVDILLLDVVMPEIDGLTVLKRMKQNPRMAQIPVVVSTSETANERDALILGADDFISKPFDPVVVQKRVENIVVKHVLEREKLRTALIETETELQSLADSVPGGILIYQLSKKMELIYCNDSFCQMYGYDRDEFHHQWGDNLFQLIPENQRKAVQTLFQKAAEGEERTDITYPIRHRDGDLRWIRLSAVQYREADGYPIFRAVAIDVTESKQNEELIQRRNKELRHVLEHDQLTNSYNRATFCRKAAEWLEAKAGEQAYAIVQMDIERFKVINELYGGETGDQILLEIAGTLRQKLAGIGIYGRLEADHFVACLPGDRRQLLRIKRSVERAVAKLGLDQQVNLYYGIYPVEDLSLPVDLMCDRARLALQSVKGNYNRPYAFYNEELHAYVMNEQELANDMNSALAQRQFEIYLQPVFDLFTGKPISAEALVRWNHPVKGLLPPGRFIPSFENNGLIVKLDAYIRQEVCRYLSDLEKSGGPTLPISVNISRLEVYDPRFVQGILDLLRAYQLKPCQLRLEITESAYMDNPEQLFTVAERLRREGLRILMDDFGSGYSSLNMLRDVSVDILKLDMGFLADEGESGRGAVILKEVVRMANELRLPMIAEGVETEAQVQFLKEIGCTQGQGYFYARPMPASQFAEMLQSGAYWQGAPI